ncbi:MAG: PAS domain S-box protein, partial [Promethearchaeia archaeon]
MEKKIDYLKWFNNRNLYDLFDLIDLIVIIINYDEKIKYINRFGLNFLGYSEKNLIGKKWFDICLPTQIKERIKSIFKEIIKGKIEPYKELIYPILLKNDEERLILWKNTILKDKNNSIIALLCIGEDLSNLKRTEAELKKINEEIILYNKILENISDAVIIINFDFKIIYWNKKAECIFGWKREEIIGKEISYVFKSKKILNAPMLLQQISKREFLECENVYTHKDGSELIIKSKIFLIHNNNGFVKFIAICKDITKKKKLKKQIKKSEAQKSIILDAISDLIIFLNKDYQIIIGNKALSDTLKIKLNDLIGQNCCKFWNRKGECLKICPVKKTMETGNIEFAEIVDFNNISWFVKSYPVKDDDGKIVGAIEIRTNITEFKKLKRDYQEEYKRAEFYKDLFTHDINNILQNIKTSVELYDFFRKEKNFQQLDELIDIISSQIKRGERLVSNIRKLSQLNFYNQNLNLVNIYESLRKVITYIKKSYRNKQLNIQLNFKNKKIYIYANDLIIDLFENILINSIIHNNNDIIEIIINSDKLQKENINYIKLEFIDNGMGIPDERKELVFQRSQYIESLGKSLGL